MRGGAGARPRFMPGYFGGTARAKPLNHYFTPNLRARAAELRMYGLADVDGRAVHSARNRSLLPGLLIEQRQYSFVIRIQNINLFAYNQRVFRAVRDAGA